MTDNDLEYIYPFYETRHGSCPDVYDDWKEILEKGHDRNEQWTLSHYHRRTSPLFCAVLDENIQLTQLVLSHGARLEDHNGEGRTVLQEAVILGNLDLVLLLLDRGGDLKGRVLEGYLPGGTALDPAVTEGLVDVAKILLEHGCDVPTRTEIG